MTMPFELQNPREDRNGLQKNNGDDENKEVDLKKCHVVIVDDDDLNLEIGRYMLEKEGINVYTAQGGKEFFKLINETNINFDMIFMDINMPEMDGFEVTEKVRNMDDENIKDIPIIALSAQMSGEEVEKAMKVGMNTYMIKPIDEKKILRLIKSIKKEEYSK